MLLEKPERIRDDRHIRHVAKYPCCLDLVAAAGRKKIAGIQSCDNETVVAHHLTHIQPKARGLKAGDQWTVPLCHKHHEALHRMGDEGLFWALMGIDARALAEKFWKETLEFRKGNRFDLDPPVKPLQNIRRNRRVIGA